MTVTGSANSLISLTGTGDGFNGFNLAASTTFSVAGPGGLTVSIPLMDRDNGQGAAALLKTGSGLMILTANETYTGGTTVNGGTLQLNLGGQTGTLASNTNVTVNAGGVLECNATDALGYYTNPGAVYLTVNNGGLVYSTSGRRVTLWNAVNLTSGTLASSAGNGDGTGNYSLNGQLNATSGSSGNPAAITATQLGLQGSPTVFNVTRGSGAVDLYVSSALTSWTAGAGLTVQGNGFTVLTGSSNYTGGTTINGGTLQMGLGDSAALGSGSA